MSINPYESPDTAGKPPEQKPRGVRRVLLTLLAVVVIPGAFVLFCVLPNVRFAGPAARRSECANNLKQIALALHLYHDEHGSLPPAYTVDAEGKPLHSWRTLILPYLEQKALYDKIDLSKPWDDPANKAAFETDLYLYRCPSTDAPERHTTYLAVVAPGGCFRPTEPRGLAEITDDHNLTLMVVEVDAAHAVHWMSPQDASEELILAAENAAKPPHSGGAQAACSDGSIRFLSGKLKPAIVRALISITGNDDAVAQGVE